MLALPPWGTETHQPIIRVRFLANNLHLLQNTGNPSTPHNTSRTTMGATEGNVDMFQDWIGRRKDDSLAKDGLREAPLRTTSDWTPASAPEPNGKCSEQQPPANNAEGAEYGIDQVSKTLAATRISDYATPGLTATTDQTIENGTGGMGPLEQNHEGESWERQI